MLAALKKNPYAQCTQGSKKQWSPQCIAYARRAGGTPTRLDIKQAAADFKEATKVASAMRAHMATIGCKKGSAEDKQARWSAAATAMQALGPALMESSEATRNAISNANAVRRAQAALPVDWTVNCGAGGGGGDMTGGMYVEGQHEWGPGAYAKFGWGSTPSHVAIKQYGVSTADVLASMAAEEARYKEDRRRDAELQQQILNIITHVPGGAGDSGTLVWGGSGGSAFAGLGATPRVATSAWSAAVGVVAVFGVLWILEKVDE